MNKKYYSTMIILFLITFFISSCSEKPITELRNAENKINEAKLIGADKYATAEFISAQTCFSSAKTLINKKKYNDAKIKLIESISLSKSAISETQQAIELEKFQTNINVVYDSIPINETSIIDETIKDEDTVIYIVQIGDNLSKIAEDFYGNPLMWKIIYEANKGKINNPNLINFGQELIIPKMEINAKNIKNNKYIVQDGDCLWSIANEITKGANPSFWKNIYETNINQIADSDLIYVGQILNIPEYHNIQ